MDEDYDAADLENWFLSVQSADGQVVIHSFHRLRGVGKTYVTGTIPASDWQNVNQLNTRIT